MKGWRNRGGYPFFMKYSTFPTTGTGGSAQFGRSRFLCKAQEIISTPPDNRMACRLTAENKYCMFPSLSFSVFHEVAWVRLVRRRPLTGSGVERLSAQTAPTQHIPHATTSFLAPLEEGNIFKHDSVREERYLDHYHMLCPLKHVPELFWESRLSPSHRIYA
jgi:hypothetical protein